MTSTPQSLKSNVQNDFLDEVDNHITDRKELTETLFKKNYSYLKN
jgi:hypothetical protein